MERLESRLRIFRVLIQRSSIVNLYVGNLAKEVTEEDLRQAFEAHGQVASVNIIKDKFSGEPRGFGFVDMPGKAEAAAAMEALNGQDLKGRSIVVNEARPREERPRGGGRGRGGFGGGRGGAFGGRDRRDRSY
jgi:RNA recognition motif-containing protein